MEKNEIITTNSPTPADPYSQAIMSDGFVYVSGQCPADPKTGELKDGITAQTEQVIDNLEAILSECKCTLANVVKSTVYLSDVAYFGEMNEVYSRRFPKPYPARTTMGVQLRGILVEIEVVAKLPK